MAWNFLQSVSPYETWQNTEIIPSSVSFVKFQWDLNTPRLLNYIAQSNDGVELFGIQRILSNESRPTILELRCPEIWIERRLAILCPKIWVAAMPQYIVSISVWQ